MTVTIEEFAEQGLQYPQDASFSPRSAFTTHAQVFGTHRDADLLNQSNWSVYLQELPPGTPDEDNVYEMRAGHWLVGWYTHLMVRVYHPEGVQACPDCGSTNVTPGEGSRLPSCDSCHLAWTTMDGDPGPVFTEEFRKAYSLYESLQDYPVLDDEDYSEREYQDALDTLKSCYNVPEECLNDAYCYLSEYHDVCRSDDIRDSNVYEWYTAAHLDAPDWLAAHYKGGQA